MFKHKTTTIVAAAAAAAALGVFAGPSAGSSSMPITTCGQVVTTNAVLTQNLNCAANGIVVGASGISIDLKGHVLEGSGPAGWQGVRDLSGFDHVAIKNGVIRNFATGVWAVNGADNVTVSKVVTSGNGQGIVIAGASASVSSSTASGNGSGIFLTGTSPSVKSSTASGNSGYGIEVHGASSTILSTTALGNGATGISLTGDASRIASSDASGNGIFGVLFQGNQESVTSTSANGNGSVGMFLSGGSFVLKGNQFDANGFTGGSSDGAGVGIDAGSASPTGTSVARGNDDSVECIPASLCPITGSKVKAGSTPISSCNQTVTTNVYLTADLFCPGVSGIVVGASGITIDLNGHIVRGDNTPGHYGIDDGVGRDDITVKNGVVSDFHYGVVAGAGADNVDISNVVASGNSFTGILVSGDHASIASSTSSGNGTGINLTGASASIKSSAADGNKWFGVYATGDGLSAAKSSVSGNGESGFFLNGQKGTITSMTIAGNAWVGMFVGGAGFVLKSAMVSGNGTAGVALHGDAATLKGNRAYGNGFPGGASDATGLGIQVDSYTTAPIGSNRAGGNDSAAECDPAPLC